jgi:hypothetical protein
MNWLRRKLIAWLDVPTLQDFWLEQARVNEMYAKGINLALRIKAAENSCRLVEAQIKNIEAVTLPSENIPGARHSIGDLARMEHEGNKQATELRYDKSAAEARGMSLEEYRAFKEATRGDKLQ